MTSHSTTKVHLAYMKISIALLLAVTVGTSIAQPSLRIVSPMDGAVIASGQTLIVKVEASGGTLNSVQLIGPAPIGLGYFLAAPPYEFKINLPADFISPNLGITALGIVKPGQNIRSETIAIDVERLDPPVRLASEPRLLPFREIGDESQITVIGTFADNTKIDLTYSTKLQYVSANPAVATVDKSGTVTAVGAGSTRIVINGSLTIPVTVPAKRR